MNNLILNTDSYKASHWLQYPPNTSKVFSYIESRGGAYDKTVFFGLQMLLKEYFTKPVTMEDVEEAANFWKAHGEPFNYEGWKSLVEKHGGRLPLLIKAVPEGMVIPTHNILVSVENTDPEFFWLTSYIETMLVRGIWYPTTVATISWHIKQVIKQYLEETADDISGLPFKLHDFGARGVSSFESAGLGGAAHLVNFMGTDTVTGALHAMKYYNTDDMVAFSIPASEHSTMTTWGGPEGEIDAMRNMLKQYAKPDSLVACVSDSYDIHNAIDNIWGNVLHQEVIDSGATLIVRPDSGWPPAIVLDCLKGLDKAFGHTVNNKGYKVLNHVRVIQGDGIDAEMIDEILKRAKASEYSADNLAFGCGGGLLQKMDRDTQRFAMKASAAEVDGHWIDVFKDPVTDKGKASKKGRLGLYQNKSTGVIVTRREAFYNGSSDYTSVLETVFCDGDIIKEYTFDEVRKRAEL